MRTGQTLATRRMGAALLVFALLLTQTMGLLHRAAHLPASLAAGPAARVQVEQPSFIANLFTAHDSGTGDCRLYDQLGHGDAAPAACMTVLPFAIPAFLLHVSLGEALARWAALFDARGPPVSR